MTNSSESPASHPVNPDSTKQLYKWREYIERYDKIILYSMYWLLVVPLIIRAIYVDNLLDVEMGAKFFGAKEVVLNDAIIYFFIVLLLYISFSGKKHRVFALMGRVLAILLLLIYFVDCMVIINFNTHLTLQDSLKYTSYSLKYIQQISSGEGILLLFLALVVMVIVILNILSRRTIRTQKSHLAIIALLVSLLSLSFLKSDQSYIHSWAYRNIFQYNTTILSQTADYSDEFVQSLKGSDIEKCIPNQPIRKNVILLMVESLSSYQSLLFSGLKDWTPNLDAIAQENVYFTNFFANGFVTEDGEVSLLTGLLPIYPPEIYTNGGGGSFSGFYDIEASLPRLYKAQGYTTEFLTTADLEFANTEKWANSIGFDYVEGAESHAYDDWPRLHFNAAPDAALYERILDRVNSIPDDQNYFFFVKTVSTHHPFINPENGHRSEAEVFSYADREIGIFYAALQAQGFFDAGTLIIVGDHHAMIPIKSTEVEKYGYQKAPTQVPLIIVDNTQIPTAIGDQYQQVDVFNSLKNRMSNTLCTSDWRGHLFGPTVMPPRFVAFRRGDIRNMISVFSKKLDLLVMLDGDNTRVIEPEDDNSKVFQVVVDKINDVRIAGKHRIELADVRN